MRRRFCLYLLLVRQNSQTGDKPISSLYSTHKQNLALALSGVFIGFINGFLGGGGGVLVVVVLLSVLGYDQHKSQATAMLIILPISLVSAIVYIVGQSVEWLETLYATIGVMIGGVIGAMLLKKISGKSLKTIFALIMVFGGIKMLFS